MGLRTGSWPQSACPHTQTARVSQVYPVGGQTDRQTLSNTQRRALTLHLHAHSPPSLTPRPSGFLTISPSPLEGHPQALPSAKATATETHAGQTPDSTWSQMRHHILQESFILVPMWLPHTVPCSKLLPSTWGYCKIQKICPLFGKAGVLFSVLSWGFIWHQAQVYGAPMVPAAKGGAE